MQKSLEYFAEQLAAIHPGGITVGVIDTVRVNGQPISHIASTMRDSNRIAIMPWDRSLLGEIDAALKKAGFESYVFSKTTVVVSTAAIVTAAEQEKVKSHVNKLAEDTRVSMRNIRQKARKQEGKDADKRIQAITDEFISKVNELTTKKLRSFIGE